jgi:magnesium transporter
VEKQLTFELSKEFAEQLQQAVNERDDLLITNTLEGVNPADITETLEEFSSEDSRYVLSLLDVEIGSEIISGLDDDTLKRFLKIYSPKEIAQFIEVMDSDDAVDVLNEQSVEVREEIIAALSNQEKIDHILDLMRYDEDVAGGLMAKELIKANVNWTIEQTIEEIRRQGENVTQIYSVYVVDNYNTLIGKVSLRKMLIAKDGTKIKDIYQDEVISVETSIEEEEVVTIMKKYDLEAIPVINMRGKLMGRITIDDVVDVMTEQAEEERQLMAGISEDVEEDDNIWLLTRARMPWLIIGLIGSFFGAEVIGLFEDQIVLIPVLASFIPLITATGGNVAIQSSSMIVQSLATKSVFRDSNLKRLVKVIAVAILNGLILALLAFTFSYLLRRDLDISIVVAVSLTSVVLLASLSGTITPLILDKLGINPAAASGPFITTANDLMGLAVYFMVAYYML